MVELYYTIVVMILALTLPLASEKLSYCSARYPLPSTPYERMNKNRKNIVRFGFLLIGIALVMLCMSKPEDIADNQMYLSYYMMGGATKINRNLEPAFGWIVNLSPTFVWMIAIFAVLSVTFHLVAILWNSPNIWLTLLLYLPYTYILHDVVQIRAAVAIALMLIAIRFIVERKWIYYYAFVAVAICFHYSAVVFLFLYFIPYRNLNKWFWSAVLVVAAILSFLNAGFGYVSKMLPIEFVQEYLYRYMGSKEYDAAHLGPVRIAKVVIAIIMLFNLDKIKKQYSLAVPVMLMFIFSQLCYLLLMDIPVLQGRMGELFVAFEIFALAMFPYLSKKYYYLLFVVPLAFIIYHHMMAGYPLITLQDV